MDFEKLPELVAAADRVRVVADASLLSHLQFCDSGLDNAAWVSAESLLADAASRDTWINRSPAALIIDGRDNAAVFELPPVATADNLIVVVESLDNAACAFLTNGGYAAVTVEEISNGRLALSLRQLVCKSATGTFDQRAFPEDVSNTLAATRNRVDDRAGVNSIGRDKSSVLAATTSTLNRAHDSPPGRGKEATVCLNQIAVEMINRVDLQSLLQHIAENACLLTNADYAYVAMVHESEEFLETIAASSDSQNLKSVRHRRGEGVAGQAWVTGKTVCAPNYQSHQHRLPGLTAAAQACSVPLLHEQRVIGVIGILYESFNQRIEDQVGVLEMFAPLASVAIDNAKLHENTRLELARTEAISKISRAIYSSGSFDSIIDRICTTLIDTFDASKTHLYKTEANGTFVPLAAWEKVGGRIVPTKQAGADLVAESVASWCIDNQQSAFIRRGVNDERESAEIHRVRARWRLGSTICLPLVHEDRSWGVLFAHRTLDRSDFTENDLKQFELIGAQISIALLRRELMVKVEYQAFRDSLTGLCNRWSFESTLLKSVEREKNSVLHFAVMSIDLVGFKAVNDSYGHRVGDELLKLVAAVLSSQFGREDLVARMGGDEFSVIVASRSSRDEIIELSQHIHFSLSQPFEVGDVKISVGASIGICFFPTDATGEEVLKHAEFAMYHAKNTEQVNVSIFNKSLMIDHENRVQLETDLRYAMATSQFELYYQPKVNCGTGLVDGVEALVRWNHPTRGFVSPSEFIPVAERCGLIESLGAWVLDQACRDCAEFQQNHRRLKVAVNISAKQFNVDDFVTSVFATLEKNNLSADCLELEVTESVVMHDISTVVEKLAQLRGGGITIAIDDFGTGYSSLQYLAELPLDVLKIDKSFVDRIDCERDGLLLVKTILMMSRELNLKTVAEGVESRSQLLKLQQLACDYIQGYYYSKPVPAGDLSGTIDMIDLQNEPSKVA